MSTEPSQPDGYLRLLQQQRLIDPHKLAPALQAFSQQRRPLPEFLIDARLITPWQNRRLLEGHTKGYWLGKHKLLDLLGSSPTSEVYLTQHIGARRLVVRVLPEECADHEDFLKRLYRETQNCSRLDHDGIVRLFDVDNEGKKHYVVMPYIEGQDLGAFVGKFGPLPLASAAEYIRQASDALAHAHERGIIHYDIKPDNLLLDPAGVIRIREMGLVKLLAEPLSWSSRSTPRDHAFAVHRVDYLSPEQTLDEAVVNPRTDIYSLGCVLYFLLTGQPPHPEGTLSERLMKHHTAEPRPIAELCGNVSPPLVSICRTMMAKKPADRYQTCDQVRDVLADWLAKHAGG